MSTDAGWNAIPGTRCQDMTSWMKQQYSANGQMMWRDPDERLATCEVWVSPSTAAHVPAGWCDAMVDGMRPHMTGNWGDWDMNGPMMGG